MLLIIGIHDYDISHYITCALCLIRLVELLSFHLLLMGKLETAVLVLVLQLFLPKIYNVSGVVFCQSCRYCPNDFFYIMATNMLNVC